MTLPHPTEKRPWGDFQNLFAGDGFLVKLIEVRPDQRLSLQRHFKREEFWVIVSGTGEFELNGSIKPIGPGDMLHVRTTDAHRVGNNGKEPLLILELQKGECREDDIERLADDYERA